MKVPLTLLLGSALVLGVVDHILTARFEEYGRELQRSECYPLPCPADLDRDGVPGHIAVIEPNPEDRFEPYAVFVDGGRELLRIPYDHTDNTLRTHIGVLAGPGSTRVVVYDGTRPEEHVRTVYAWDGARLVPAPTTGADSRLLDAMESRDDTGTFHAWVEYRLLRWPLLVGLPILALLIGCVVSYVLRTNQPA